MPNMMPQAMGPQAPQAPGPQGPQQPLLKMSGNDDLLMRQQAAQAAMMKDEEMKRMFESSMQGPQGAMGGQPLPTK